VVTFLHFRTAHPTTLRPFPQTARVRRASVAADSRPLLWGVLDFQTRITPFLQRRPKMIANALLLTVAVLLTYGFWLMDQLKFMAPYKGVVFHEYGTVIFASAAILFFNIFAAVLLLQRKFLLKDTGRKLSHLDRQFQVGQIEMPAPPEDEVKS
jgi:hypothetical protein